MSARLFVSYSRRDAVFAERLRQTLHTRGFDVFVDTHDIAPGEEWRNRLATLIEAADVVLFVLSPDAAKSETCEWEVNYAERVGKRILPVVHRDADDVVPE